MIKISRQFLADIIEQARRELPAESCGYVFGPDRATAAENYPMTNTDHSPEHFTFDPAEQFAAIRAARAAGKKVVGNWHSHPSSPSRPSQEDIRFAVDPTAVYFILSLQQEEPVLNAFHVENGKAEKLEVEYY